MCARRRGVRCSRLFLLRIPCAVKTCPSRESHPRPPEVFGPPKLDAVEAEARARRREDRGGGWELTCFGEDGCLSSHCPARPSSWTSTAEARKERLVRSGCSDGGVRRRGARRPVGPRCMLRSAAGLGARAIYKSFSRNGAGVFGRDSPRECVVIARRRLRASSRCPFPSVPRAGLARGGFGAPA